MNRVACKSIHSFNVYNNYFSYPAHKHILSAVDHNDNTVVTSNVAATLPDSTQCHAFVAALTLNTKDTIVDSGAMQIFVMEGTPVHNKQPTSNPLHVLLPDGHAVTSTHDCNIIIHCLPVTLKGHIIPNLKIASLFGIQGLIEAGCKVTFDHNKCIV